MTFRFSPQPNRASEIRWREWGPDVFAEAAKTQKPVFLSISAVWCHWCHVMDETSFSDAEVIEALNEDFICVRVDADRRPDIQERYLMGGWPTIAVLTPAGGTVAGASYVAPDALKQLLAEVVTVYGERYEELVDVTRRAIEEAANELLPSRPLDGTIPALEVEAIRSTYDADYGGFGREPKFPNHPAVELLMRRDFLLADSRLTEMVTTTLDAMAGSELFDAEWGGFFRYATQRNWGVPHFEKLLSDQAGHVRVYSSAYLAGGDERYLEVAARVAGYVDGHLSDAATGALFGSQDADEEFYALSAEARPGHKEPFIDRTSYTVFSARMVSALLLLERASRTGHLAPASRALDYLLDAAFDEERGVAHVVAEGEGPSVWGLLRDAAALAEACLDRYEFAGGPADLQHAVQIAAWAERSIRDSDGGYFDRVIGGPAASEGALVVRQKGAGDNANMARVLRRLALATGDERYRTLALDALAVSAPADATPMPDHALYALALDEALGPQMTVRVPIGSPLRTAALSTWWPGLVVLPAEVGIDAAVVCAGEKCFAPAADETALADHLSQAKVQPR